MTSHAGPDNLRADVAVVGAGAAGLFAALSASLEGATVVLVSRAPLAQSASYWAQGGIAAALALDDSTERHLEDTVGAGRAIGRRSAARVLCEESPDRVHDLERMGVHFDADRHGALALGLEGGHSARRVVHAGGSATGRRITRDLSALAAVDPRIDVIERTTAGALWTSGGRCIGLIAEDRSGRSLRVLARGTILATGGAAALWERSTNPRGAIGAGMTLALHAGADLADLEFQQFHPTALVSQGTADGFLITEAIRGEGATLLNAEGERFVDELAPRDEVALAVRAELDRSGKRAVMLDMRKIEPSRFPNVTQVLIADGIDQRTDLVPVAPAAHYTMGGVTTGLDAGTTVPSLFAVGECGCNGLHGANRLASNSLAECFVFGRRAALAAADQPAPPEGTEPPDEAVDPRPLAGTRAALWRLAGLERRPEELEQLCENPFPLARLIGRSALHRVESRGAHFRVDAPEPDPRLDGTHTVVGAAGEPRFERWE